MTVRCRACHDELLKACVELAELKAEAERLRKQNKELHTKLAKLKAKTAHHLRERDRYRDLYTEAHRRVQELTAKYVEF